ncbi:hypothetical protein DL96DRAFT_1710173 [Flagelloscypha sp. PMI_526]|nr:hypothetical protein DL96DRAFT_1710173 [Flagelloscypha sp. PMI_526]
MVWWDHNARICGYNPDLVEDFRSRYVTESYRSAFFEESWFLDALSRLQDRQLFFRNRFNVVEGQGKGHGIHVELERTGRAEQVIRDFLALPILAIPELPLDISREVFLWAASCHHNPWTLTLVSTEVQEWVDSLLFHTLKGRFIDPLCSEVVSPRLARAGCFVKEFQDFDYICRLDLSTLVSRCPNVTTMMVHWAANNELKLPLIGSLKRLHCRPYTFGTIRDDDGEHMPNFSSPCFRYITHLSIDFQGSDEDLTLRWDWALDSMAHLEFLWMETTFCGGSWRDMSLRAPYVRDHVLPRLPSTLECFFWHLEDEYEDAEEADDNILRPLADGSLDHRLVLVVSVNDARGHPDALEYSQKDHRISPYFPRKKVFWDEDWCERGRRIVERRKKEPVKRC